MRNLVSRWCALALLMIPLATSAVFAQTFTGGLRGAVKDSGGVVPGVTVTLTNEATQIARETTSNAAGEFKLGLAKRRLREVAFEVPRGFGDRAHEPPHGRVHHVVLPHDPAKVLHRSSCLYSRSD